MNKASCVFSINNKLILKQMYTQLRQLHQQIYETLKNQSAPKLSSHPQGSLIQESQQFSHYYNELVRSAIDKRKLQSRNYGSVSNSRTGQIQLQIEHSNLNHLQRLEKLAQERDRLTTSYPTLPPTQQLDLQKKCAYDSQRHMIKKQPGLQQDNIKITLSQKECAGTGNLRRQQILANYQLQLRAGSNQKQIYKNSSPSFRPPQHAQGNKRSGRVHGEHRLQKQNKKFPDDQLTVNPVLEYETIGHRKQMRYTRFGSSSGKVKYISKKSRQKLNSYQYEKGQSKMIEEWLEKIKRRVQLSRITFTDTFFKNGPHEIKHLENSYIKERAERRQLVENVCLRAQQKKRRKDNSCLRY